MIPSQFHGHINANSNANTKAEANANANANANTSTICVLRYEVSDVFNELVKEEAFAALSSENRDRVVEAIHTIRQRDSFLRSIIDFDPRLDPAYAETSASANANVNANDTDDDEEREAIKYSQTFAKHYRAFLSKAGAN